MRVLLCFLLSNSILFAQKKYDVCIYGGTSAGVIAAYSAEKMGMNVILIEPSNHLGGLSSGGLGQTDIGNKYAITGLSRDFYRKVGSHYGKLEQWIFEPHVTENLFNQYINKTKIKVVYGHQLISVNKENTTIQFITIRGGRSITKVIAKSFIDCSYEGDLMAKAGVKFHVGREANNLYGETWNGVQLLDKHQFPDGIDPYKEIGKPESGLLWGISNEKLAETGSGDAKLQAYNFRLCLTDSLQNQIPISKPDDYDSTKFELLLRYIEKKQPSELNWALMHIQPMPHHKTDINNSGPFSTDMIGENYDYANASFEERKSIIKKHENYTKSFLYFLGNDLRVPKHLRDEMKKYGYPKDEYLDNQGFSHQVYVREARRMIGELVMTQLHCEGQESVDDGVGMAAYTMDSHNTQRIVIEKDGKMMVKNEGDVQQGIGGLPPYPISYRAITPKEKECSNLLVPVCLSASHIAYGSIRMEPVFMVLGQSAGMAAALAVQNKTNVQKVDVKNLQKILKENPYLNGSIPEILIDNDSKNVSTTGSWSLIKKGYGKYGKDYLISADNQPSTIDYQAAILRTARYKVYVYISKFGGISPEMTVYVNQKKYIIETNAEESDWKLIDVFQFEKNQPAIIKITTENAKGSIIADAVLLIPE